MRTLLLSLGLLVCAAPQSSAERVLYAEDDSPDGGTEVVQWQGTPQTLPMGYSLPPSTILASAFAMESVRLVMDEFARRGYVRRPDLDYAECAPLFTAAGIAYEKPGWATHLKQPVVIATTKRAGDYMISQVVGGIVSGDATRDSIAFEQSPEDPSVFVEGQPISGADTEQLSPEGLAGVDLTFATAHDPLGTWSPGGRGWHYVGATFAGAAKAWGTEVACYVANVSPAMAAAAMTSYANASGQPPGLQNMRTSVAAMSAYLIAHQQYFAKGGCPW